MDICAFADAKQNKLFPELNEEIIIEIGDVEEVTRIKIEDVFDDSCPIVITGFCFCFCFILPVNLVNI